MKPSLQKKLLAVCSQSEIGRRLNRRAQTVNGWFKHKVPGELVLKVSKALEWKVIRMNSDQISTQTQRMDYRRSKHANHLF